MENLFGKSLFEGKKIEDVKKQTNSSINFHKNNRENFIWTDKTQKEEEMNWMLEGENEKNYEIGGIQKGVSHESIKSSTMAFNEDEWNSEEEEGKEEK